MNVHTPGICKGVARGRLVDFVVEALRIRVAYGWKGLEWLDNSVHRYTGNLRASEDAARST